MPDIFRILIKILIKKIQYNNNKKYFNWNYFKFLDIKLKKIIFKRMN